jgi:hypothetical protein
MTLKSLFWKKECGTQNLSPQEEWNKECETLEHGSQEPERCTCRLMRPLEREQAPNERTRKGGGWCPYKGDALSPKRRDGTYLVSRC